MPRRSRARSSFPYERSFLAALLGTPGGSERLIEFFSTLPPNESVVVIIPEGNWNNIFTALILNYFGWPREVRMVSITRENAQAELQAVVQASPSAIFYCGVVPPASSASVIQLGKDLVVVRQAVTK